jgi:hypothetical protein
VFSLLKMLGATHTNVSRAPTSLNVKSSTSNDGEDSLAYKAALAIAAKPATEATAFCKDIENMIRRYRMNGLTNPQHT